MDSRLHSPWRVKAPRDVAASKGLLFYLFVFIWITLTTELLGKGDGGVERPDLGFLKVEGAGSVGEGIWAVVRVV